MELRNIIDTQIDQIENVKSDQENNKKGYLKIYAEGGMLQCDPVGGHETQIADELGEMTMIQEVQPEILESDLVCERIPGDPVGEIKRRNKNDEYVRYLIRGVQKKSDI